MTLQRARNDESHAPPPRAENRGRPPAQTEHLAFIDALRGWAFLSVLVVHVQQLVPLPAGMGQLGTSANYGVQLFFVISALTLVMSFESRLRRDPRPLAAFFIRRLLRIAPLFWLAVPVYLLFYGTGPKDSAPEGIHPAQVLATIFFVHGWHPTSINSVVPGGWSIAVEMNFYLLFPACFAALTSLRRSAIACATAFVLSIPISVATRHWLQRTFEAGLVQRFTYYWLPREMPVFLLGFVLFYLIRALKQPGAVPASWQRGVHRLPVIVVPLLVVMAYVSDHLPLAYFWFSCAHVLLALGLSLRPAFLLVNAVTQYIGKVSYSAYITHFLVVGIVGTRVASAMAGRVHPLVVFAAVYIVCAAGTVLLSSLTYRLVEIPGQNLGRSWIRRLGYATVGTKAALQGASAASGRDDVR